jgi:hypothetical protein
VTRVLGASVCGVPYPVYWGAFFLGGAGGQRSGVTSAACVVNVCVSVLWTVVGGGAPGWVGGPAPACTGPLSSFLQSTPSFTYLVLDSCARVQTYGHTGKLVERVRPRTGHYWACCGLGEETEVCVKAKGGHSGPFKKTDGATASTVRAWLCLCRPPLRRTWPTPLVLLGSVLLR